MTQAPTGEVKPDSSLDAAQKLISAVQAGDAQGVLDAIKALTQTPESK